MKTKEELIQYLRDQGHKITPQRLAVIDVLIEQKDTHPGARLIYEEAKKKIKTISLSTVYGTLNEFSRCGLIKTLQFDQMENRYDGNLEGHINLICERCRRIIDYPVPPAIDPGEVSRTTGFVINDARLEYYGWCRDCLGETGQTGKNEGHTKKGGTDE